MKSQIKTNHSDDEDDHQNEHEHDDHKKVSSFIAHLQQELNSLPLDHQLKELIKAKENQVKSKIADDIVKQPSIYDYFSKIMQNVETSGAKPTLGPKIGRLMNQVNEQFYEKVRSNKIKYSEVPQDLTVLITDNYKNKKYEDFARKKQIKDVSQMKQDLEKKLLTMEMELDLLKAREFSTPNYKNELKMPAERTKDIDEFIKKKANERKEIEHRRKERIAKMMEDMKKKEEDLRNREKVLKESLNKEKLERIQKNIEDIQQRMVSREEEAKEWKDIYNRLKKSAPPDLSKKFEETQKALFEKTTQEELMKIKEKVKRMDPEELKEFMKKHDEEIKLKKEQKMQELKELRKQLKERSQEFPTSSFNEKASEDTQEKLLQYQRLQEFQEEKRKRVENCEKRRKELFLPKIDEDKKEEVDKEIAKLKSHKVKRLISKKHQDVEPLEEWDPREAEAMDQKVKGKEYLAYVHELKKKENGSKSVDDLSKIEDKNGSVLSDNREKPIKRINYMKEVRGVLAKKNDLKSLKNLINDSSLSENFKRDQIKAKAAYWEEKARMKEDEIRLKPKKKKNEKGKGKEKGKDEKREDDNKDEYDEVNQLYINSVKAKLALFKGS